MRVKVFHGTEATFDEFSPSFQGSANGTAPINMAGFNFTDSLEVALTFGPNVIEAEVTYANPLVMDANGEEYGTFKHVLNRKLDLSWGRGHDCVVIRNYRDAGIHQADDDGGLPSSTHYIPRDVAQVRVVAVTRRDATAAPTR